jgi:hypothetical protein
MAKAPLDTLWRRITARRILGRADLGLLLSVCSLTLSIPCMAHHSGALWDQTRKLTLQGTVKQFQWINPHCFIQLLVPVAGSAGSRADQQEWSIEMASPYQVLTGGWKPGTLKPGDKIAVTVHPARDGTLAGNFVSAVGLEGKLLGQQGRAP